MTALKHLNLSMILIYDSLLADALKPMSASLDKQNLLYPSSEAFDKLR